MSIENVTYIGKQPAAVIPVPVSFVDRLPAGETIQGTSTVTATAISTGASAQLLVSSLNISSPIMQITFSGGVHGEDYDVEFIAITQNYRFPYDVIIQVREL